MLPSEASSAIGPGLLDLRRLDASAALVIEYRRHRTLPLNSSGRSATKARGNELRRVARMAAESRPLARKRKAHATDLVFTRDNKQ